MTLHRERQALPAHGQRFVVPSVLSRYAIWWALVASCVLVGLLYGRALGFSFLFDDTFDLPRVEGRSYWSLLTSSEGYSYYRPGPFLIWKFTHDVLGYYSQPVLHGLTLIAHALTGWLLGVLVSRLGAGWWALVPALLFLTYPFSYQNVAIVGTLFHPLAAAAILLSVNLYLSGRRSTGGRAWLWHVAAIGATVVALWSHESGVVVTIFILGVEALVLWQRAERRPSLWTLGHISATLAFVVAWLTVERVPSSETAVFDDMHSKALFFAQGFSYPFSAQITWLEDVLGWSPGILQMFLLSMLIGTGAYIFSARDSSWVVRLYIPVAGLLIALVAALPAMLRLSWPYIQDAPRLLYLVGMGSALFWGLLPMLSFGNRGLTIVWRATTLTLLALVVVQSWVFIERRMELFAIGSETVDGIVAQGERHAGQGLVVINAPAWLAQREYEYPYGHLGVQVIPSYIGLDRVIYTSSHRSVVLAADSVAVEPDVDGDRFTFGPHGGEIHSDLELDGRTVVRVKRHKEYFEVYELGRVLRGRAEAHDGLVPLGDGVFAGALRSVSTGDALAVYLSWNLLASPDEDLATVEILDGQGQVVDRYRGTLLGGVYRADLRQPGDRVDDTYRFERPVPGTYTVRAGFGDELHRIGELVVR